LSIPANPSINEVQAANCAYGQTCVPISVLHDEKAGIAYRQLCYLITRNAAFSNLVEVGRFLRIIMPLWSGPRHGEVPPRTFC